jgi:1-acyl-sn-glycerol-3-phosphate acyltransferase
MSGGFVAWFGRTALRLAGWRIVGERPAVPKYVLITAPHTSNWDFPYMMLYGMAMGIAPRWVGKHTLFRAPFGGFMRTLGGIPVRRDAAHQMVDQLVETFRASERLALVMPPEGSRSRMPYWKSGFYYVARGADVPIVMSYLDFSRREGGIGPMLQPGGDMVADMAQLRAFYADKRGLYPEKESPVRLKQEDEGG